MTSREPSAAARLRRLVAAASWIAALGLFHVSTVRGAEPVRWSQWRGPLGTGAAPNATPPVTWSEDEGVRWKRRLPGLGHSTPVIWDDHIFLTTAIPVGDPLDKPRYSGAPGAHDNLPITHRHRFEVLAVRRGDGNILWRKAVNEALPHEGGHSTASLASASPVTDGKHVFAFFGSYGLYCLDFAGQLKWQRDLGKMQSKHGHGEGSSPVLYEQTLVVNWDHEGRSFLLALDAHTGKDVWRVERQEVTSWATPTVAVVQGKPQVIVSGTHRVRGYDLKTGKVVWECGGMSANIVATPVVGDGLLFAGSSYEKRALLAIRLKDAAGDITGTDHVVWNRFRGTPYVPSPLLYRHQLYFLTHYQGILTRVDAETGQDRPGAMRLGGIRNVYASPVAADGRVYVTDLDGTTLVIDGGEVPRVLAVNRLDDSFSASAAVAGDSLYLRGNKYLYRLAEKR